MQSRPSIRLSHCLTMPMMGLLLSARREGDIARQQQHRGMALSSKLRAVSR